VTVRDLSPFVPPQRVAFSLDYLRGKEALFEWELNRCPRRYEAFEAEGAEGRVQRISVQTKPLTLVDLEHDRLRQPPG
jgi:hypothetical protein